MEENNLTERKRQNGLSPNIFPRIKINKFSEIKKENLLTDISQPINKSAKNLLQNNGNRILNFPINLDESNIQQKRILRKTLPFKIANNPKLPPSQLKNPYLVNLCKDAIVKEKKNLPNYMDILKKINDEFGIEEKNCENIFNKRKNFMNKNILKNIPKLHMGKISMTTKNLINGNSNYASNCFLLNSEEDNNSQISTNTHRKVFSVDNFNNNLLYQTYNNQNKNGNIKSKM